MPWVWTYIHTVCILVGNLLIPHLTGGEHDDPDRRTQRGAALLGTDPLPRGRQREADRLRPRLPGRRPALGRSRRPPLRPLPLPRSGLAAGGAAGGDEPGRRSFASRP